jgi:cellulose synthase/poly-beta-1,6-N-acetylglucosamine synthase-like glycosyltransferase
LLAKIPYASFSLAEDLEFGIELGMQGVRVAYADEAHSDGEMVSSEKNARGQRRRWEQGRMAILRSRTLPLLKQAVVARSRVCLDLALDLLVLPISYVAANVALLTAAGALLAPAGAMSSPWFWLGVACFGTLVLHIFRGWQLSGTGLRGLLDLVRAPFFLLWKIAVVFRGKRATSWVRTDREGT